MHNDAAVMAAYHAMNALQQLEPPHPALERHQKSMTDMALASKNKSFDAVLAISVLHELDCKEKGSCDMRRVRKTGGVLRVSLIIAHSSLYTSNERHRSLRGAHNLLRITQEFEFEDMLSFAESMLIFVFISCACVPKICFITGD